jgi:chaperone required for assembly of F1-ATPase
MSEEFHAIKRFFKDASASERDGGFTVLLDGRALKTPAKQTFLTPTRALAELCVGEWGAQGDVVRPETMAITRLVNVALDRTPAARAELAEFIAGYAATDLVCHRAAAPASLVARQGELWDPLVAWARERMDAPLEVTIGVTSVRQSPAARAGFLQTATFMDDFRLTGLAHAVGMMSSGVVGFAFALGRLNAAQAFAAAFLDEQFQLETWGEDMEARARLDHMQTEIEALGRYFAAL